MRFKYISYHLLKTEVLSRKSLKVLKGCFPVLICSALVTVFVSHDLIPYQDGDLIEAKLTSKQREKYVSMVQKAEKDRAQLIKITNLLKNQTKRQKLPGAIGIGAKKCGTTALFHFLQWNPKINIPSGKFIETFFFNTDQYYKGTNSYRKTMQPSTPLDVVLEKTPDYFASADVAASRIKQTIPSVKLILLLCDPVERAFSEYYQKTKTDKQFATRWSSFHDYVVLGTAKINKELAAKSVYDLTRSESDLEPLINGIYEPFLKTWLDIFDKSQILILDGGIFYENPGQELRKVQSFLNLETMVKSRDFVTNPKTGFKCLRPWWKQEYDFKKEILQEKHWEDSLICSHSNTLGTRSGNLRVRLKFPRTSETLNQFYKHFNENLFKLLDKKFTWM